MAFTHTTTKTVFGNKKVQFGTFTSSATSAGGEIVTGMNTIEHVLVSEVGSSTTGGNIVINETLPLNGSSVTIVTASGTVQGTYEIKGH